MPADVIRNSWDEPWNGVPGSTLVKDKLMDEINSSIGSLLVSLGSASNPTTTWANQVERDGAVVDCGIDRTNDDDGNAYSPPICVQTTVEISLSPNKFNLNSNADLDLESAYQSLLIMGGQVKTDFPISIESGHKSTYYIDPPAYATIVDIGGPAATKITHSELFPYNSGKWESNNLDLAASYSENLELTLGYRTSAATETFNFDPNSKGLDLDVILDLSNENAATMNANET